MQPKLIFLYGILMIALVFNIGFWLYSKNLQAKWGNVPPVPKHENAQFLALSDPQFAYRQNGVMIQNFGDIGGRFTPLNQYNFATLGQWFFLMDRLDPESDYMPFVAGYYYGLRPDRLGLGHIVDYLEHAGGQPYKDKWRWLAHAVFLARHKMENLDRALELAHKLAASNDPNMPIWGKQMRAFILAERGDKQSAYDIMLAMLKTIGEDLHPAEVNFMVDYICTRLLDGAEATQNPLCDAIQ